MNPLLGRGLAKVIVLSTSLIEKSISASKEEVGKKGLLAMYLAEEIPLGIAKVDGEDTKSASVKYSSSI